MPLQTQEEFKGVIVPLKNGNEAALVGGLDDGSKENMGDVADSFNGTKKFYPIKVGLLEIFACEENNYDVNFFGHKSHRYTIK